MSDLGELRIVVCHRGWVFVGYVSRKEGPCGPEVVISRAKNIRDWGTTEGLGQLTQGPKSGTVLDSVPGGTCCLHPLQIIWSGPVAEKGWDEYLADK